MEQGMKMGAAVTSPAQRAIKRATDEVLQAFNILRTFNGAGTGNGFTGGVGDGGGGGHGEPGASTAVWSNGGMPSHDGVWFGRGLGNGFEAGDRGAP